MKRFIFSLIAASAFFLVILIVACETHKDPFSANNVQPVIVDFRFRSDNVLLPLGRTDSLKFKAGETYRLHLQYEDPEFSDSPDRKLQAQFSFESGGGKIRHDQFLKPSDDGLTFGEVPGKFNDDLFFTPDTTGIVRMQLQLSDGVKVSDASQISVTFFPNLGPIASFAVEVRSQTNPYEVRFDPTRSRDRDGTIEKFIWTFGDNSAAETVLNISPITHKYTQAGQFRVRLKAIDDEGEADSTEQLVTTANQPPVAALQLFPQSGSVPLLVEYTAAGSFDPDGSISSYQVLFGDGGTAQTETGKHTYLTDKNYQAVLIVKDNFGLADTARVPVQVSTPPIAALKIDPASGGPIPLRLTVSGKDSYDPHPSGEINTYLITITNLSNNARLNFPQDSVTTLLTAPANYLIALEVTNNRNLTSRAEKVIPAGLPSPNR
jgi:PKD repeat protein